jgi:hypothetical protein
VFLCDRDASVEKQIGAFYQFHLIASVKVNRNEHAQVITILSDVDSEFRVSATF